MCVHVCVYIQGKQGKALGIKDPSAGFDLILSRHMFMSALGLLRHAWLTIEWMD